jgi:hypothetical protein
MWSHSSEIVIMSGTHHYRCKSNVLWGDCCDAVLLGNAVVPGLFVAFDIPCINRVGAEQYVDEYLKLV